MNSPGPARLLGDIGGTNARFAWQSAAGAPLQDIRALGTAEHPSIGAAIRHYLAQTGRSAPPWCAIGIANPITGDRVQMTNSHWSFSISELQRELGFERLRVINDFTALALALPDLAPNECRQIGGTRAEPDSPIALIGPGTGLGVSGLLPGALPGQWVPLQGEGGHVTLAATNEREAAVLSVLRERFGHASAERAVAGMGLEALHAALGTLDGGTGGPAVAMSAAEITAAALAGGDSRSAEAVALFCSFLGNVAGNLALTLGARGGVYIGGGIVPRLGTLFDGSAFRERFEAKGRLRSLLAPIPVYVIQANVSPALLGAARAL
jgi:glucokinase